MKSNDVLLTADNFTVVSEYIPTKSKHTGYQSEQELEKEFISLLQSQGYQYININNEQDLINNLRLQLENLNNIKFTEADWNTFLKSHITNTNSIIDKTRKIQEERVFNVDLEDPKTGNITNRNIKIVDVENITNNRLQVINQYENEGKYKNIYDVTILLNGLPVVHVELKKRGGSKKDDGLREAFNQINRYQRDSFWANSGLYQYIQIFIISNGTFTKYYSNSLRETQVNSSKLKIKNDKQQNFRFTNYWADANNKRIPDLMDFTKTFLTTRTLLNVILKYCVFNTSNELMIMRPYQIAATEKILNRVKIAEYNNKFGTKEAGGYIFHTTGSGKTLTSFKTARLLTENKDNQVDKVVFVVDRQDLDYQTMLEFNKFKKGCVSSSTSTKILTEQIEDKDNKIIITTIQKLAIFIKNNPAHSIYNNKIVFIFDECHRSQFGEMNKAITKNFKKYVLFGFTGTPIYEINANKLYGQTQTTKDIFGDELHTYTIIDAINDKNVLPFKVDYTRTIKDKQNITDEKVEAIDIQAALEDPRRINNVVDHILKYYNTKTYRNNRLGKFNSILAVSNINMAIQYYQTFKNKEHDLKIAMIYSYDPNENVENIGVIDEENTDDTDNLDKSSRDFLENAIKDYNEIFGTQYDTGTNFKNYYKHISKQVKKGKIDILIVVNMFLTGFDAKKVNTLWVDKNLKHHGLIQAFSRTNRIYNDLKTHGNIVNFRDLRNELNDALSIFAQGENNVYEVALIKTFNEYYSTGYIDNNEETQDSYKAIIKKLTEDFPVDSVTTELKSETDKKEFIQLFNKLLRVTHILSSFDEFEEKELLNQFESDTYKDVYLRLKDEFKIKHDSEKTHINEDVVFEIELIRRDEVNIDYILHLIENYVKTEDKEVKKNIDRTINANVILRSKKTLINKFIEKLNLNEELKNIEENKSIQDNWVDHVKEEQTKDIETILKTFQGKIKKDRTTSYLWETLRTNEIKTYGEIFDNLFISSRFKPKANSVNRSELKKEFVEHVEKIFEKYMEN